MKEKVYCPVCAWDCEFYRADGTCVCPDVLNTCDDFAFYYDDGGVDDEE